MTIPTVPTDMQPGPDEYSYAADVIGGADYLVAFTGAGISVESGVPSFRGEGGIWERYDPSILEIEYFLSNPKESWRAIREIFYRHFARAEPNVAHKALAYWEEIGLLKALITQNIDDLHYRAGNREPIEYHGNSRMLICTETGTREEATPGKLESIPPLSERGSLLKPDFVFFGEGIPPEAARRAEHAARTADVMLVIGTTGEVYPAAQLPRIAGENGATIIEINPLRTTYTESITDIFLRAPATMAMERLSRRL
jgi:NAD-dependent deacetylase